jgi:phospholipase/lecithinase/hemolysin
VHRFLRLAFGVLLALVGLRSAVGAPYSQLVVFGDSLSDVGNVDDIPLITYPGAGYWQGRFSNGSVYAEHLASGLGLGTLVHSGDGGTNYAYGGAQIAGLGGITGFFIDDINEQIDDYLSSHIVDPAALYVVWGGANNFFNGEQQYTVPLGQMSQQLSRLAAAGVRHLLVPNLPPLGSTPEYNTNAQSRQTFNTYASNYNSGLYDVLDTLEMSYPEISLFRLDVERLVNAAIDDPASHGLVNVTDQAAQGLEPGRLFYSSSNIVPNPQEYLFWDNVHPTAAGHRLLADYALELVALPGDFNQDGQVDTRDFVVWRNQLGTMVEPSEGADANGDRRVDVRDFRLWKSHFGKSLSESALSLHRVPEPGYSIWLLLATILAWRGLRSGYCEAGT